MKWNEILNEKVEDYVKFFLTPTTVFPYSNLSKDRGCRHCIDCKSYINKIDWILI